MRLHIGVAPGGGKDHHQASIIFVEHRQVASALPNGRETMDHMVVHVERQAPVLEVLRDRILVLARRARPDRPCFFIDAAGGIGTGLVKILTDMRKDNVFPQDIHKPEAYTRRGVARQGLVNAIVEQYGSGRLKFATGLPLQAQLIRALETYESQVADDGKVSFSGDEEMVIALGLALGYYRHGAPARYIQRDGKTIAASRLLSTDPY
jgi:hypothetical protein